MGLTYQVLVAALEADDVKLYREMQLNSDAIIVNQCEDDKIFLKVIGGNNIKFVHSSMRGVGKSRNLALNHAKADIVEFADDDMIFIHDYSQLVIKEFEKHPEADVLIWGLESLNANRPLLKIRKFSRVHYRKALKYGCARISIRRKKLDEHNIRFSELFGGGSRYGSGEDTIFLTDCLKAGLKIYEIPTKIADVKQEDSTWFTGYTDKYYKDKGALFAAVFPHICYLYAFLTAVKSERNIKKILKNFSLYCSGIREYKVDSRT